MDVWKTGLYGSTVCFKEMYTILKLNFVALTILVFPLLLLCILETCTNILIPILSALVASQRKENSLILRNKASRSIL